MHSCTRSLIPGVFLTRCQQVSFASSPFCKPTMHRLPFQNSWRGYSDGAEVTAAQGKATLNSSSTSWSCVRSFPRPEADRIPPSSNTSSTELKRVPPGSPAPLVIPQRQAGETAWINPKPQGKREQLQVQMLTQRMKPPRKLYEG